MTAFPPPTRNDQLIPEFTIELYLYDLSHGMARMLSPQFLGKQIDGIWHTGVVVYGYEYYYGGGIVYSRPGQSSAGHPVQKIAIGHTTKTQQQFHDWLQSISHRFTQHTYSLLRHNCNNFSNECCQFLCNTTIPTFITDLPQDAFSTPQGMAFKPMIEQIEAGIRVSGAAGAPINLPWANSALLLPPIDPLLAATGNRQRTQAEIDAELQRAETVLPTPMPAVTMNESGTQRIDTPANQPVGSEATLVPQLTEDNCKPLLSTETKQVSSFHVLIKTSNKKQSSDKALTEAELANLEGLVKALSNGTAGLAQGQTLFSKLLLQWPDSALFPVLALFRLFLLNGAVTQYYATPSNQHIVQRLLELAKTSQQHAVVTMSLCSMAHLVSHVHFLQQSSNKVFEMVATATAQFSAHQQTVRLMAVTLLFNIISCFPNLDDASNDEQHNTFIGLIDSFSQLLDKETDMQVIERSLLALGHLIRRSAVCALLLDSQQDWQTQKQQILGKVNGAVQIAGLVDEITKIIRETAA